MRVAPAWSRPRDLGEAVALLAGDPQARPVAGGTDVMVLLRFGALECEHLVDVWGLDELRGIVLEADRVVIGALTTYTDLARHPDVAATWPALAAAARVSGAWAVRNRGTLGGNVANASPAADSPPVLLVHGARIELASASERRWIDYAGFHVGYRRTACRPGELITRIAVPRPAAGARGFYRKVGTRRAQAISKVCVAGLARWRDGVLEEVRVALGSVAPTVVEARRAAAVLVGRRREEIDLAAARAALDADIAPIDDVRSTAAYRRRVAGNLLEQFLEETAPG